MKRYVIRRLLLAIPLLLAISFVCFVFINIIPSNPAEVALRVQQMPIITEEAIAEMEEMLGIPVVPVSAAKNQGISELVDHAVHIAKYQERPGRTDFCGSDDKGGAVHRCLHGIMHLIEDHASGAGIPVRFAASKLAEGDDIILEKLNLSENERETSFCLKPGLSF